MEKIPYTKKLHACRLISVLEGLETCHRCPGEIGVWQGEVYVSRPFTSNPRDPIYDSDNTCHICMSFVGIESRHKSCPCNHFGAEDAARLSWIALESGGYI